MSDSPKITLGTMLGGEEFVAQFKSGKSEKIIVRTAKLSEANTLASVAYNVGDMIKFCTGKSNDWIDDLTVESGFELFDKCREVNRPILDRMIPRLFEAVRGPGVHPVSHSGKQSQERV